MPKVTMPQLGESVAEGTIGKWLKNVGDSVAKYEPIVEVITDKVNAEVPSPFEGTLTEILVQEGETVPNNAEIAVIEAAGAAPDAGSSAAEGAAAGDADRAAAGGDGAAAAGSQAVADETGQTRPPSENEPLDARTILGTGGDGPAGSDERPTREGGERGAASQVPAPPAVHAELAPVGAGGSGAPAMPPPSASDGASNGAGAVAGYEGRMTPAVRRLAREHKVDLSLVTGTGHAGRVTREDVMRFVESGTAAVARPQASDAAVRQQASEPTAQAEAPAAAAAPPGAPVPRAREDELKPMTAMRRAIASHMVKAVTTAPHAYTTVEVDMSGAVALRESVKGAYQAREAVALSYVAIVGKAVVEALRKHADINAHWTDDGLLRRRAINLGIAVAVDDGLVVPSIKNADQLSIHGLNLAIQDFAARARANRLKLDDVQGGTFTLNNTGWFGSVASQPIINVPEVAILSMEAIVKRPVVVESPAGDTIGIRPIMNVCVSFDHRATDGAQVGRFVQDVKRWLEGADASTPIW